MLVVTIVTACFINGVLAYGSRSPPASVCDNMLPEHGTSPQTSVPQYTITLSKSTYSANEQITVTLKSTSTIKFKGFLIQPRLSRDTTNTYGNFINLPAGTSNPCSGKTAVSHNTGTSTTSIAFTWTAPPSNVGSIVFVYTVVQQEKTYWVKQTSATLTYQTSATSAPTNTSKATAAATTQASPVNTTNTGTVTSEESEESEDTEAPNAAATTTHSYQKNTTISKSGETPASPSSTASLQKGNGCGKTVGCFHNCKSEGSCEFLLTWLENGDDIDLTLSCGLTARASYCAIGLSRDDKMGDDSVFQCVYDGNTVTVSLSYNEGRTNYLLDVTQFGLTVKSTTYSNGVATCKFSRKKTFALAGGTAGRKKRAAPAASNFFDMNNDWTLFYASGPSSSGYVRQHDSTPLISSQVADFQSVAELGATKRNNVLVKVHGILMTLAWLFCATLGIFMARFYKLVWPEGMEWCGLKRWFQVHRACMVLTLLLTAIAFIIIFVEVRGYPEMEGDDFDNFDRSHPVIGIIVMALVLINPIMALFRPHPGTPKRPIFNVAHTLVGVIAHVGGVVNLFSGTKLPAAETPSYARIILYVFVGWAFLIEIISHLYECNAKKRKEETYEMKQNGDMYDLPRKQMVSRFKLAILGIHVLTLIGLVIAVCVIIGVS